MTRFLTAFLCMALVVSLPARAQDDPVFSATPVSSEAAQAASEASAAEETPGGATRDVIGIESAAPQSPGDALDEPLEPKAPEYEDQPQVELRILDKVRAESRTYILNVGRTVAYSNIRIRPRACRKSSPLDDPENAAFLQIWEVKSDGTSSWIFSGWMFASSPSLSAMDHPVYDVTVLDCRDPAKESQSDSHETTDGEDAEEGQDASTNETPVSESAAESSE